MNVYRLLKLAQFIVDNPEEFDMSNFGDPVAIHANHIEKNLRTPPYYQTACCFAGLTVGLFGNYMMRNTSTSSVLIQLDAEKILELQPGQGEKLFFVYHWQPTFAQAYELAKCAGNNVAAARVGALYIKRFIGTNGGFDVYEPARLGLEDAPSMSAIVDELEQILNELFDANLPKNICTKEQ